MSEVRYEDGGKVAVFRGERFTRDECTGYYLAARKGTDGRRERLHVAVWEAHNGPLPDGMQVHHRDLDKRDNEADNLVALTASEHSRLHAATWTDERRERARKTLIEDVMPKAVAWHRSAEGRAWHRRHGRESWKGRLEIEYTCTNCGRMFKSRKVYAEGSNRFCSNNCKSAFRKRMGYDNETRRCEICGAEFVTNRYSTRKRCADCRHKRRPQGGD